MQDKGHACVRVSRRMCMCVFTVFLQVVCGMCYLHGRKPSPIVHGDLKCSNLLIENDGSSVVIADFGLAAW